MQMIKINSMEKVPFFSIVIANYNHGKFLEEAILSILNQNCDDYEIIMVDGGSNDNSIDIIKKYNHKFSWWVSEKDGGQSNAFNKGFDKAKGQFYFWLNADDLLLPNTLNRAKEYLLSNKECVWLAGNTITMDENRLFKWCIRGPIFIKWLVMHGTAYVYGPTSIFKKELFLEVDGFEESLFYTMDTDLWYKFLNRGYEFQRINHYCWAFRIHENSKTSHSQRSKPNEKFIIEKLQIEVKNNREIYKFNEFLIFLLKIISGSLVIRWVDNLKMKNTYL
jgi:glycosyltransferase involved in cell wall biosynthesis